LSFADACFNRDLTRQNQSFCNRYSMRGIQPREWKKALKEATARSGTAEGLVGPALVGEGRAPASRRPL
jgi:hypothetical protein